MAKVNVNQALIPNKASHAHGIECKELSLS